MPHITNSLVMNHMQFGEKLKEARKREGFRSVDELAEYLAEKGVFISPRSLRRYEHGTHNPSSELLAALMKALPSDRGSFYFDSFVKGDTHSNTQLRPERQFVQLPLFEVD